jgi:Host cell surface-exposed lipoprotein
MTQQQQSAVASAKNYLGVEAFSLQGLIDQLDSPEGGGYSVGDATIAVNSLSTDWNAQAVLAAKQYLKIEPFSCADLTNQLDSPEGGKFTPAQATYGATQAGDC